MNRNITQRVCLKLPANQQKEFFTASYDGLNAAFPYILFEWV